MPSTALIFSPRTLVKTNWPVLAERMILELSDFIGRSYHNLKGETKTIPGKPGYPLNLIPSGSKNGIGATTARVGTPLMSMLSSVPTAVNGKRRCAVASTLPRE
jgi:hypothetical protein